MYNRVYLKESKRNERILTIVMPNCEDYQGFAFTMVNLLQDHREVQNYVEYIVLDNAPDTACGEDLQKFMSNIPNGYYSAISPYKGTMGAKNAGILAAQTEYVMCIDSHLHIEQGALSKLIKFLLHVGLTDDLLQGPLLNARGEVHATHMNPGLSGGNFGRWGTFRDENKRPVVDKYVELPMHGMGLFVVRRDTWLGFHPAQFEFGAEEGYIHEKYRLNGRKCWLLPFLRWWHFFAGKSAKRKIQVSSVQKYRNQLIGWTETSMPLDLLRKYWSKRLSEDKIAAVEADVATLNINPLLRPANQPPILGYPIRLLDEPYSESPYYSEFEKPIFYE